MNFKEKQKTTVVFSHPHSRSLFLQITCNKLLELLNLPNKKKKLTGLQRGRISEGEESNKITLKQQRLLIL